MSQTEIDITSTSRPAAIPRVPKTSNTLPDMFVGARKLLKDTPWMTSMGFGLVMSTLLLCPAVSIWFHDLYVENKEKNRPIQPWYVIICFCFFQGSHSFHSCSYCYKIFQNSKYEELRPNSRNASLKHFFFRCCSCNGSVLSQHFNY